MARYEEVTKRRGKPAEEDGMAKDTAYGWAAGVWEMRLHDQRARRKGVRAAHTRASTGVAEALAKVAVDREVMDADLEERIRRASASSVHLLSRGIYSAMYQQGSHPISAGPAWVQSVATAVAQAPAWGDLMQSVAYDPDLAALATAAIVDSVADVAPGIIEELHKEALQEPDQGGSAGQDLKDKIQAAADAAGQKMHGAVRAAVEDARQDRQNLNGLAPGLGSPPLQEAQSNTDRMQLAETLRHNDKIKHILDLAGRIVRISRRTRKQSSRQVREEIVNIERGGDLFRLLPSELAQIADADLEILALARLVERSALQYELKGKEPLGRGPMVVLLDISGSMDASLAGYARLDVAKAVGAACIRVALEQRRKITIACFDDRIRDHWTLDATQRGPHLYAKGADIVMEMMKVYSGGGTSFARAIDWALGQGMEEDRADLIMVTDGRCSFGGTVRKRVEEAQERDLRVLGVVIANSASSMDFATEAVALGNETQDVAAEVGSLSLC